MLSMTTYIVPEAANQPSLDCQADGCLPLGADREVQAVSRHTAPAQDALAVQERQQTRVLLTMEPNAQTRPESSLESNQMYPELVATRHSVREHDTRVGGGTHVPERSESYLSLAATWS